MTSVRRLVRRAAVVGGALLLVGVALWLGARVWALNWVRTAVPEFEAKHGSLDAALWRRPSIPTAENAGKYMEAAALLFEPREPFWSTWLKNRDGGGDLDLDAVAEQSLEQLAQVNRLPLEIWLEGGKKDSCVLHERLPEPYQDLPPYFGMMHIARVHAALARRELREGSTAKAVERLESILAAAKCLQADLGYVPHLCGLTLERRLMPDLRDALARGQLDGHLHHLAGQLSGFRSRPTSEYLRAEAAIFQPQAWWREQLRPREAPGRWYNPFGIEGFDAAAAVRANALTLEHLDDDEPPSSTSRTPWPWRLDWFMFRATGDAYWKNQRLELVQRTARDLAVLAINVRREALLSGRYPPEGALGAPTAFVEEIVVVTRREDGTLELALPRSAAHWKPIQATFESPESRALEWSWLLPPLESSSVRTPPP